MTHVCLVATWYERNSASQHLDIHAAFFWLFITRIHYINNETRYFLGVQQALKKLKRLRKQRIVPLNIEEMLLITKSTSVSTCWNYPPVVLKDPKIASINVEYEIQHCHISFVNPWLFVRVTAGFLQINLCTKPTLHVTLQIKFHYSSTLKCIVRTSITVLLCCSYVHCYLLKYFNNFNPCKPSTREYPCVHLQDARKWLACTSYLVAEPYCSNLKLLMYPSQRFF